jgi:hypothetical protein
MNELDIIKYIERRFPVKFELYVGTCYFFEPLHHNSDGKLKKQITEFVKTYFNENWRVLVYYEFYFDDVEQVI